MNRTEMLFNQIVKDAQKDPNILAFWLDGSRGKGVITPYSDYDCTMIVEDEAFDDYREKYEGFGNREVELRVLTFDLFRKHAAWDSPAAWDRYNFAEERLTKPPRPAA
jgi:hypothetical protein